MSDTAAKLVVNLADVSLKQRGHGDKFAVNWGRIGPALGLTRLGLALHVVPPGKRAFPFHRHHVIEEAFIILSGRGEYRYGEETHALREGDLVAAPAGGKAHQIVNTSAEELRYLGLSTIGEVDVVDYPESHKIGVAAGIKNADFRTATFAFMGRGTPADYWDGEGS